jgi:hypothetical protein
MQGVDGKKRNCLYASDYDIGYRATGTNTLSQKEEDCVFCEVHQGLVNK